MEKQNFTLKNKLAIISAALLAAGGVMIETALNVTFPVLTGVFHTSLNNVQWVTTAYLLAVTVTMTISSYLTKRFGNKKIWLGANIIFIFGTLLAGFASSFSLLLVGRILEGLSAGLALPLMFNLILLLVPAKKIGIWMGIGSMVVSLAPSFGPTYGGALVDSLGWRAIFFTLLVIPFMSILIGLATMPFKTGKKEKMSFDFIAFFLLSFALVAGILTINQLESGSVNYSLLVLTVISLFFFIKVALNSKKTFLNVKLFKIPSFTLLLIPVVIYMFANLGLGLLLPNYLQSATHTSSLLAGFSLLPGTLIGAVLTPLFGSLYDRIGSAKLLFVGNTIFALSLLTMSLWAKNLTFITIVITYVLFTVGRTMAFSTGMTASLVDISPEEQSDGTAIIQAAQMFMGAAGTTVAALFGSGASGIGSGMQEFLLLLFVISILIFAMFSLQLKKSR
ncbi:MFS family (AraJ) [Fructobacillus tropaeoli]|uniref:MFS transporter n=1 Tax=Fructobacillus tropaeoli TaxID=709323 RepID=UPI002D9DFFE2|nr:MFS family (AraJ) [Fructobacillus tropaeoli]